MLKDSINTSIAVSLVKEFCRWRGSIERWFNESSRESRTGRLVQGLRGKIKVYFRYSFFGRITEPRSIGQPVLDSSRTMQLLIRSLRRRKERIINCSRTSIAVELAEGSKEAMSLSPVRMLSIIVITIIIVNLSLSVILKRQIGLWGWLLRVLFIFLSIGGLFCQADYSVLKESSVFLKKVTRANGKD